MTDQWKKMDSCPHNGRRVLLLMADGRIESGKWVPKEEDGPDSMGSDAGYLTDSGFTFPGRSFGNPEYFQEAIDPPSYWQPLPDEPDFQQFVDEL